MVTEECDLRYLADIAEYVALKNGEIAGVKYAEAFLRIPIKSKSELVKEYDEWRRKNKGKSYYDS